MKTPGFIVVYDDEMGLCVPFGWDDDCAGAIASAIRQPVAAFPDRKAARKAITISTRYARLCEAQGIPPNTDFTDGVKNVKILALKGL